MKISSFETKIVEIPFKNTIKTAIHNMSSVACVLLYIKTDEGITGQSYIFSLNAFCIKAFNEIIKEFSQRIIGKNPNFIKAIWQDIWRVINPIGNKGMSISALSAIDVALWDIIGKQAGLPLYQLFGAHTTKIKTYASSGLWLSQSIDQLINEACEFLAQGFRAMKIRIGSNNWQKDVERIKQLRQAIGFEIELMADLNQALTPKKAIQLGKRLEEYALLWIEEPVAASDLKGQATVCQALNTQIASGETEYTHYGIHSIIKAGAADILMLDLQRIGGFTEMHKAANLAESYNLPISTHIFTHQSLSIAGALPNCLSVEHISWFCTLFNEELVIKDGYILMPCKAGVGFTFNEDVINHYLI